MELQIDRWPTGLRTIKPKIKNLFYNGNLDVLFNQSPKLAIVGSRRMSDYGQRVIEKWMPELVHKGITVVSGFMYGVDQKAHQECIKNGGDTIAVLGWGIDRKVSAEDEILYQKILEVDSLILSEYPGEMKGNNWTFPQRNRIVAGISDAVLVIEGAEKSGSMITAGLALKMGKKLMSLPGRIIDGASEGTNNLIKTGKAEMVTSVEDVLRCMSLSAGQLKLSWKTETKDPILDSLAAGDKTFDELARVLKISSSNLAARLSILTIDGEIIELNGRYHLA